MSVPLSRGRLAAAGLALVLVGAAGGYGVSKFAEPAPMAPSADSRRKPLYWYDPMVPNQRFDRPGKSPFMDMQLVPKYADEGGGEAGVAIDPARAQSLGVRVVRAEQGVLPSDFTAPGVIDFNGRDLAVVQARVGGIVQRVFARAPGDLIGAGAPLADLLVPEWSGAQAEFLSVRRTGDAALAAAARQRLLVLGMPAGVVAEVERNGQPQPILRVSAPTGGVIRTLSVRSGMTLSQGQTLAEISGLSTVWLNVAVPEAMAGQVRTGQAAAVTLSAFPGEQFSGRVSAILPEATPDSRTLTARIELANRGGRLRPGMYGQIELGGATTPALLVPSEAVIRTGRRTLVMLALPGGRYRPAEVQVGREGGDRTEILAGLQPGEQVVASGQFLLDSEASLAGVQARPVAPAAAPATAPALYETTGRIERLDARSITLSHQPVPALQWPAMTMGFTLADPMLANGLKVGDQVRFAFDQVGATHTVRRIAKTDAAR
jgi:Cu(I)/Ag(I) efflux system membrane fusion protein